MGELTFGRAHPSRDFSRYDEQADTITAVGLVPARRGELYLFIGRTSRSLQMSL